MKPAFSKKVRKHSTIFFDDCSQSTCFSGVKLTHRYHLGLYFTFLRFSVVFTTFWWSKTFILVNHILAFEFPKEKFERAQKILRIYGWQYHSAVLKCMNHSSQKSAKLHVLQILLLRLAKRWLCNAGHTFQYECPILYTHGVSVPCAGWRNAHASTRSPWEAHASLVESQLCKASTQRAHGKRSFHVRLWNTSQFTFVCSHRAKFVHMQEAANNCRCLQSFVWLFDIEGCCCRYFFLF